MDSRERQEYYDKLLKILCDTVKKNNPDLQKKKKIKADHPELARDGSKKLVYTNFKKTCEALRREPEHVMKYIMAELSVYGSIDSDGSLIIRGKFRVHQLEEQLKKYTEEYVCCAICRSVDTEITKDSQTRCYQLTCNKCTASRTVAHLVSSSGRKKKKRKL